MTTEKGWAFGRKAGVGVGHGLWCPAAVLATCLAPLLASAQTASALPVASNAVPGLSAFHLAVELGRSEPRPMPGPWARFSLAGQEPSPHESDETFGSRTSALRPSGLAGFSFGRSIGTAGPVGVSLGLGFTHRSGYAHAFTAIFATMKKTGGGTGDVFAYGDASGHTELTNDTLMATLQVTGVGVASRFMGLYPWAGVGVGGSRTVVEAQTTALNLSLQLRGPGFAVDDRLGRGELQIAPQAFNGRAWQIEAGLGLNLTADSRLGFGLRFVHLGRYRLIGQTSEWRLESQGEALRLAFAADPMRLSSREAFMSFHQAL